MRLINLIDNCGQLLATINHSKNSADRAAEAFFLRKRKLIGSKERKFISQAVWTTLRNLLLTKNIAQKLELHAKLNHKSIFPNANETAVLVLVQLMLSETCPEDFDCLETEKILYKKDDSSLNLLESICIDIEIIKDIQPATKNQLIAFLKCDLQKQITAFYADLKSFTIDSCKNHAQKQATDNILEQQALTADAVALRFSFPTEFLSNLLSSSKIINQSNLYDFAKAMNFAGPVCLRVNQSLCSIDSVLSELQSHQIKCHKSNLTPAGIVVQQRPQLTTLESYKQGYFTVQDEASQLVGYCINPNPGDTVLDACAGAGGKSLHLADLKSRGLYLARKCDATCALNEQANGIIVAADISQIKIKELEKRAELSGFRSIITATAKENYSIEKREIKAKKDYGSKQEYKKNSLPDMFDIVLVDAPCTGSGTIRRDPTKKYSIQTKTIKKIAAKQLEILTGYSKYVRPGGVLVYSTCSIFSEENQMVVEQFLKAQPDFAGEPLLAHLSAHNIILGSLAESDYCVTLFPFIHGTDGFFICRMRRSSGLAAPYARPLSRLMREESDRFRLMREESDRFRYSAGRIWFHCGRFKWKVYSLKETQEVFPQR